jgi:hypothetical protein
MWTKRPGLTVVGSEHVCTSITTTSNGTGIGSTVDPVKAWNHRLKFYNDDRGYVNTTITKDALTADLRVLDYVTNAGTPSQHKSLLRNPNGVPGREVKLDNWFWRNVRPGAHRPDVPSCSNGFRGGGADGRRMCCWKARAGQH